MTKKKIEDKADQARVDTKATASDSPTAATNEPWIDRLNTITRTVGEMTEGNERDAALYYVVARYYGNRVGDFVLAALRRG